MLHATKLLAQFSLVEKELFKQFDQEKKVVFSTWERLMHDNDLSKRVQKQHYTLLVPEWQGEIGAVHAYHQEEQSYICLGVDGSQIYYDKHQGPPCYVINVGAIELKYGDFDTRVALYSEPFLKVLHTDKDDGGSVEFVNLEREKYELAHIVQHSKDIKKMYPHVSYVAMFDGPLVFFHVDIDDEKKVAYLQDYFAYLTQLYEQKILYVGYISLPKNTEFLNVVRLELAQYDEQLLHDMFERITDSDIAASYLQPGQRTVLCKSKAPVAYLYPEHSKPYFCYMHVGAEIVRLEMPAWIAHNDAYVEHICRIILDQVSKGYGYPVALFEAHEQAVIKSSERALFYNMLRKMSSQSDYLYVASQKSLKKEKLNM